MLTTMNAKWYDRYIEKSLVRDISKMRTDEVNRKTLRYKGFTRTPLYAVYIRAVL
jgi:hypothetical protein